MPQAYVFTRYGGPETEALVEVERPVPGPGQPRSVVKGDLDQHVVRRFPFAEAGEALRTVEDGHARGKVVIEVAG